MPLTPSADRLAPQWPATPAAPLPTAAEALPLPSDLQDPSAMSHAPDADPRCLLAIHLDDGTVFEAVLETAAKTREQIAQILRTGHTHAEGDVVEIFPPHRIHKITVQGPGFAARQAPQTRVA